ncbi:MAG: AhpC/TSA family protein [Lewinella sp.]|nr:AhpC/TSA family protein [Lewinella sp.]
MVGMSVERQIMEEMVTNVAKSVWQLSFEQPVLLVFLRHFGCMFCREALADIARRRADIEELGSQIVFVHMSDDKLAERYFNRYDLAGATHVSDPECQYYAAFGLVKGNFTQLFGLQTWIRGFNSAVIKGNGIGPQLGDGFQMPGVFVIQEGEIRESFIHKLSSDRPDYEELVRKCCRL